MLPIEQLPIVDQVVERLQVYITEQGLQPGDKMPTEKEVGDMFQVGRSTVREAYRMLKALGILESRQGKGSFLSDRFTQPQGDRATNWFREHGARITDYMEVRMAVEPLATRFAIERATQAEIEEMESFHRHFQTAQKNNNVMEMAVYDEAFHKAIIKSSHNLLFIKIERDISECFADYRMQSFSIKKNTIHALDAHGLILDAFHHKDSASGEAFMKQHLKVSLADMQKVIQD